MYVIRDSRPEDLAAIFALDQECFPPGIAYTEDELRRLIRTRGSTVVIAEADASTAGQNALAGFAIAGFATAGRGASRGQLVGHLITIDVRPEMRRNGAGSALLRALEAALASAGATGMRLEVAVDNEAAQNFYRRHGYEPCGHIEKYYLDSIDALLMEKVLRPA